MSEEKKYLPNSKIEDLTGKQFFRLTPVECEGRKPTGKSNRVYWKCRCSCGNPELVSVSADNLKSSQVKSCGCYHRERIVATSTTHGHAGSRTYVTWINVINRCRYDYDTWKNYHEVSVCERWKTFENFLADMGERPENTSIDRIDGTQGYQCGKPECPECGPKGLKPNCRWATAKQQANNISTNIHIEWRGVTKTLCEWAEELGYEPSCLRGRYNSGWDVERMLTEPSGQQKSRAGYEKFNPLKAVPVDGFLFEDGDRKVRVTVEGEHMVLAIEGTEEKVSLTKEGAKNLYNLIRRNWKPKRKRGEGKEPTEDHSGNCNSHAH